MGEEIATRELKSKEILNDLRQEVEEYDTKHRKKSRKELRKHLQDKIVKTASIEPSTLVSKEFKLEKIKEMEDEREKLQQKLEELKLKRISMKGMKSTAKKRYCDEKIPMDRVKSPKIELKTDSPISSEISNSTDVNRPV